jgi:hypothetical protein
VALYDAMELVLKTRLATYVTPAEYPGAIKELQAEYEGLIKLRPESTFSDAFLSKADVKRYRDMLELRLQVSGYAIRMIVSDGC